MDAEAIAGRYRREERLGTGGMAEVWAARDEELDRRVAIKLLGPGADRARFDREARAAAGLSHPNICQLYDYGEFQGRPFMVLECLPGGTLEDRLAPGLPLADEQTAQIAREVAAGLAHAHEHGLVHRDLKPSNILFDAEGRAKIADFGIARLGDEGTFTEAGTVLGTAAYLSPEQAAGEAVTPATDVYAFGVILYRMLSGRLPFEGEQPLELARKHRTETPRPLTALRPDVPPVLESVAAAALAKSPADRPPDGGAVVDELSELEATLFTGPPPEDPTQVIPLAVRRPRPARRRRGFLLAAAALLLVGGGVAAAFVATGGSSSPAAPPVSSQATFTPGSTSTGGASVPAASVASTQGTTTSSTGSTETATTEAATTEPGTTVTGATTVPAPTTRPAPTTSPSTTSPPPTTTEPTTTELTTTEPLTTSEPPTTTIVAPTTPTNTATGTTPAP